MPPPGLPESFLQPPDNPFEFLIHRYARTHGPFLTRDIAQRFDLQPAQVEPVLHALANAGILVQGEIRPGGIEMDWCEIEVLRRLKRRTLARLRHAVALRSMRAHLACSCRNGTIWDPSVKAYRACSRC